MCSYPYPVGYIPNAGAQDHIFSGESQYARRLVCLIIAKNPVVVAIFSSGKISPEKVRQMAGGWLMVSKDRTPNWGCPAPHAAPNSEEAGA
jgi:hypothetical protein